MAAHPVGHDHHIVDFVRPLGHVAGGQTRLDRLQPARRPGNEEVILVVRRTRPGCVRPLTSARTFDEGRAATSGRTSLDTDSFSVWARTVTARARSLRVDGTPISMTPGLSFMNYSLERTIFRRRRRPGITSLSRRRPCVAPACAVRSTSSGCLPWLLRLGLLVLVREPRCRLGRSSSPFRGSFGPCGRRLRVVFLQTAMFVFAAGTAMTGLVAPRSCAGRSSH